jgi:hypothetical protein
MQTKHYRKKAVAICEAMAGLHKTYDVIAQNHACVDPIAHRFSELWWKQRILLINKYLQTKLKVSCTYHEN